MKYKVLLLFVLVFATNVGGQTTDFTYQGQLQSSSTPATGSFDFEFALFDSGGGGSQIGSTLTRSGVTVANGIFSVSLDFGSGFPGAGRFLEIRVRQSGGGGFTTLSPRQAVTSSPYAIKSITSDSATVATNAITANNATTANNALQLGGVAANQFVVTTDPRMTNARPPTPGSSGYIQNQDAGAQVASNFSISGNGTAAGTLTGNIVNSATQFNLNGSHVLSRPGNGNLFAGTGTGNNLTFGPFNSFFGHSAGFSNTTGAENSFFGYTAGFANTTGSFNSYFGKNAGFNTTSNNNTFMGHETGLATTTGGNNSFFGKGAGTTNTIGSNNTLIGYNAEVGLGGLIFATAIGAGAVATESNSVWLGRSSDIVYVPGFIRVQQLGGAGAQSICRNGNDTISTCSSSLRYKTNINRFGLGLNLINQLKPITFDWKEGGMHDLGLGAEDVAAIEPLLVTYNTKGEVEGVKYDRIGVVLVNAVKEQQAQIEVQRRIIEKLEQRLTELERKQQEQVRKP